MEKKRSSVNVRRSKLLRISLIVLASVMLLCGSYYVTLAFLNKETDEITNTFSHPTNLASTFMLRDKDPVDSDGNGVYDDDWGSATVEMETYLFVPGVELKVYPFVTITNLKEDAYLYVEYNSDATAGEDLLYWDFDGEGNTDYWRIVPNTGTRLVYVYTGPQSANVKGVLAHSNNYTIDIVKENSVVATPEIYDITKPSENTEYELDFSAYLVQAVGFTDADAAWAATFGATN